VQPTPPAAQPASGAVPAVLFTAVGHERSADRQDVVVAGTAGQHHGAAAVGDDVGGLETLGASCLPFASAPAAIGCPDYGTRPTT